MPGNWKSGTKKLKTVGERIGVCASAVSVLLTIQFSKFVVTVPERSSAGAEGAAMKVPERDTESVACTLKCVASTTVMVPGASSVGTVGWPVCTTNVALTVPVVRPCSVLVVKVTVVPVCWYSPVRSARSQFEVAIVAVVGTVTVKCVASVTVTPKTPSAGLPAPSRKRR